MQIANEERHVKMSEKANDFPFESRYAVVDGIRLHYLDEGDGPPILMMHGQPMWSYLYRKMIPPLVAAGYRCVVPDLMGFGYSDKPTDESAYTLKRHVELITGLVEQLGLKGVTTVGNDWGGPIVLRYAIEHQDNIRSLVILNTFTKTEKPPLLFGTVFKLMFRSGPISSFMVRRLDLFRKFFVKPGLSFKRPVSPEILAQYKKTHPDAASRASIAAFPKMIPMNDRHPNAAYITEIDNTLQTWDIPVLVVFPDQDVAFKVEDGERIAKMVPNGRFHLIRNAGHFIQEDAGEEVAERMITFLKEEAMVTSI